MSEKFVFGVITYNHEKYIVEHLESIKFQVETYGKGISFKLVLADDGSKDRTVAILNEWIKLNDKVFDEVVVIADGINRGTCVNYTNLFPYMDSKLFKITAGDDVYSFENVIQQARNLEHQDYISGMPLLLIDSEIIEDKSTVFHTIATKHIFAHKPFRSRMKEISVMNTPNLFYHAKFIWNKNIEAFIKKFKVTEDLPMMVKISEEYPGTTFHQLDEVLVYYRRTAGSTYIIRESDFNNDKVIIFNHMIETEPKFFDRLILKNRLWCYKTKGSLVKKLFNINYYLYLLRVLIRFPMIYAEFRKSRIPLSAHVAHYQKIKSAADLALTKMAL